MRSDFYQYALIAAGVLVTLLFGSFLYREIFPEYRLYQDDYIALEKFRSTYTNEPPPAFQVGVKQILIERADKGPPQIDRCTSCHVALQLPHFSPTKIERDLNGNIVRDAQGVPVQVPNENYIWAKLDEKIQQLGNQPEAEKLRRLKTAVVGDHIYDVSKVLTMHPLLGKETRPFEFHSIDEYGCVSCHNGNGRGLTSDKAHGPVFDGDYEVEFMGPKPKFLESDPNNDPKFARVFNDKPGHQLLFQTTPIYVGALIQAKCVQCHQPVQSALQGIANSTTILTAQRQRRSNAIKISLSNEKLMLLNLLQIRAAIQKDGLNHTVEVWRVKQEDLTLSTLQKKQLATQLKFLQANSVSDNPEQAVLNKINQELLAILGSEGLVTELEKLLSDSKDGLSTLDKFLADKRTTPQATGSIFAKLDSIDLDQELMRHVQDTETSFAQTVADENVISAISSDVDELTKNYHNGQQLFISQACYACHRIAGLARGGIGPELTKAGENYPWFLKESIVWPQADLKTSTMPNFRLDHEELENLVTFLLGQTGANSATSATAYRIGIQEWEAGKKLPWEKPIPPSEIHNLRYSMTVFATQGCAACHRLKGYESNVGYQIEKEQNPDFEALYEQSEWFTQLFPEEISSSDLVQRIEKNQEEIDRRIAFDVRKDSILEEIDRNHPNTIEGFYSNFKFAARAKDHELQTKAKEAQDPETKNAYLQALREWKGRVHRVLMMYVQEYGLGRLIGPRPNWSGVYRSDEWLMEHFFNPASHVPRSIMPILPFDSTKFYALTYMLDVIGKKNRDDVRAIWKHRGFNPAQAFDIHCAQCHGPFLQGNGPVSDWIYPIPKNLRNANFLRNLTKERALESIVHGVKGTPMPPWSETPSDKSTADGIPVITEEEAHKIVDWIFSSLPGSQVIRTEEDVPKWKYSPKDVLEELKREGNTLKSEEKQEHPELSLLKNPLWDTYYVDLQSKVAVPKETADVKEIFDVAPNPVPGEDKNAYYIKKKFYTPENIEAGRHFFELNCAVCHGKEADGSGARASVMQDAKPRMLTNLDWLNTRDDLRLLRSIKYGVLGTSMTPWGDLTSSLQRLQLVIYIRTLSEAQEQRKQLSSALYQAFDSSKNTLENARNVVYPTMEKIQGEMRKIRLQKNAIYSQINEGMPISNEAIVLYGQELALAEELKKYRDTDELILEMKNLVDREKEIFSGIGAGLIGNEPADGSWKLFLEMIQQEENTFSLKDGNLAFTLDPKKLQKLKSFESALVEQINQRLGQLETEKKIIEGKIPSMERTTQLHQVISSVNLNHKLKARIVSGIEEIEQITEKQQQMFNQYEEKLKTLNQRKSTHD